MIIRLVVQSKLFIILFFYCEFYKIFIDISFHTETLQLPLRRMSSTNYRLRHDIDHRALIPTYLPT